MIHVDGSQQSGSGTIVRFAVAYAALLSRPLRLSNARARRAKPGLRPQHVAAVRACAELCGATTEGVEVASREFTFAPGREIRGGDFRWDIGTAGSTTMLALGVLPIACFANAPITARITGGVFQDFAPSPHHLRHVLCPLLERMGAGVELRLVRAGYVPRGGGAVELRVRPVHRSLRALRRTDPGTVREVSGVAFSSHLAERRVSERMAGACEKQLTAAGLRCRIDRKQDTLASHPGASLAIWAQTSSDCFLGADRSGARGRSSESIGRFVAKSFLSDRATGATSDRHLADQIVVFAALADGVTTYVVPQQTEHLETNLWLARRFGASVRVEARRVEVGGLGVQRRRSRPRLG
jgi:RNA 3'-terminal phosphate cyclase (ATP)